MNYTTTALLSHRRGVKPVPAAVAQNATTLTERLLRPFEFPKDAARHEAVVGAVMLETVGLGGKMPKAAFKPPMTARTMDGATRRKEARRRRIATALRKRQMYSYQVAKMFDISKTVARRDLDSLLDDGLAGFTPTDHGYLWGAPK